MHAVDHSQKLVHHQKSLFSPVRPKSCISINKKTQMHDGWINTITNLRRDSFCPENTMFTNNTLLPIGLEYSQAGIPAAEVKIVYQHQRENSNPRWLFYDLHKSSSGVILSTEHGMFTHNTSTPPDLGCFQVGLPASEVRIVYQHQRES